MTHTKWYISRSSVLDYMYIAEMDPREFAAAAVIVQAICSTAVFKGEHGRFENYQSNALIRGKMRRLMLSVSTDVRTDGYRDQLVSIRDRDDRRKSTPA